MKHFCSEYFYIYILFYFLNAQKFFVCSLKLMKIIFGAIRNCRLIALNLTFTKNINLQIKSTV